MELVLKRVYDDELFYIDFSDEDDITVDYKKSVEVTQAESDELEKFIDLVIRSDFEQLTLRHFYPDEMVEYVYDALYINEFDEGCLVLQNDTMFFISNDMKTELRRNGLSKITSSLGEIATVENLELRIGDFAFPYTFDPQYLANKYIPTISMIPNTIPLNYNIGDLYYNKFTNEEGTIYIFTKSADESYQMYIHHGFLNNEDLANFLSLLDIVDVTSILKMLK